MYTMLNYIDATKEIIENEKIIKSPYVAALQHARYATNRNEHTGEKINNKKHGSWLGAVGYMIVLDHIGNKFNNLDKEYRIKEISEILKKSKDDIKSLIKALGYFSSLSSDKIFALYALRCSLVHDFFIFNRNKNFTHHFTLEEGPGEIVTLPIIKWNGDLKNRNSPNITKINLEALGDLVEKIHICLLKLVTLGELLLNDDANLEYLTYNK